QGMKEAKELLDGVVWCEDAYDAMKNADALAVLTEWNEFRTLQIERVKELMNSYILVDLRNIFDPKEMIKEGFKYSSIGRLGE
ncbi:MAG: UDP-glucose dehydrogenase, partial [Alphaproteobacteria bacterium]|nr:UDP-glucose dehydrogenase [Alphaproteobacteria bacterium]